jgi:Nuf2 family
MKYSFFFPYRNKLFDAAGYVDRYTLRDLIKPDKIRVQRSLSAIINFWKFIEAEQQDYNALCDKTVSSYVFYTTSTIN